MTQQEDDKIIFEGQTPDPEKSPWGDDRIFDGKSSLIKGKENEPVFGSFDTLYDELICRCDPDLFLKPYDKRKIDIANDIYAQTLQNKENEDLLKKLRHRAIKELDVKFSTAVLYDSLIEICNPKNYTGSNYNNKLLGLANELYNLINENADDIEVLENIQKETGKLSDEMQRREKIKREQQHDINLINKYKHLIVIHENARNDKDNFLIAVLFSTCVLSVSVMIFFIQQGLVLCAYLSAIGIILTGFFFAHILRKHCDKAIDDAKNEINLFKEQHKDLEL